MARDIKSLDLLSLPPCPLPRTGDSVLWYADSMPVRGVLVGHRPDGRPCVRSSFGNDTTLPSFDYLRLADPSKRLGPNWQRLSPEAKILAPYPHEVTAFGNLLSQRTPPGPQYRELITEIWSRGFEVFVVGGTVRDVLAGIESKDVDLVTTMPLKSAKPLLQSMYRYPPSVDENHGFVRLGGTSGSGDPFIDMKMFCHYMPGTSDAIFGDNFSLDTAHRDFACNAVYYDPVNQVLFDPSGKGVADCEGRRLSLVCDTSLRSPYHQAEVLIRFFKFIARGFVPSHETRLAINATYLAALPAMKSSLRINYLKRQILSKSPESERTGALEHFRLAMVSFGAEATWIQLIEPLKEEILREA